MQKGIDIQHSFVQLKAYCEQSAFKGYDPYDGLNSPLFQHLPFISKNKYCRLAWIQFFKRSPIDFRKWVGIKPGYNPKAIGLFLSAYVKLYQRSKDEALLPQIDFFSQKIIELTTPGYSGHCWGYNFDWQAKAFFQPKGTPTIVASSFIANALLDAYDLNKKEELLQIARSTCDFILNDLNRETDEQGNIAFSYSPLDKSVVYNASLLGARLLSRVYAYTKEDILKNTAAATVRYCCMKQKADGSWAYGNYDFHQWVDNFHTGYNLECIADYMKYTGDHSCEAVLEKGFQYYIQTFFGKDGVPHYYSHSIYPIDIHAPSQLVITLQKLNKAHDHMDILNKVMHWTIEHMQSPKGYFYYQINRWGTSRIPYMRWSQAWMMLAFATYFLIEDAKKTEP